MNTTQRNMTSASVKAIMSKRSTIPAEAAGKRVKLLVQGNGNVVDVLDKDGKTVMSTIPGQEGFILQKKIFNVRANSGIAMQNPRTRQYLIDGLKCEKMGKDAKIKSSIAGVEGEYTAHELFNAYLNATQISFGILLPSTLADKLGTGTEIAANVQRVDTDNGSLLTIDASTIGIVEPETFAATAFDLSDFLTEEEKVATELAGAKA